jgi:hypothetical protein
VPKYAPATFDDLNRDGSSIAQAKVIRVGARALLKQLSKPNSATIVPGELAKTVKTGNPGHQLCLVIFDARRLRLLDRRFDRRQQISNSVIELGEQKGHAVSARIELRRLSSHFSLRL